MARLPLRAAPGIAQAPLFDLDMSMPAAKGASAAPKRRRAAPTLPEPDVAPRVAYEEKSSQSRPVPPRAENQVDDKPPAPTARKHRAKRTGESTMAPTVVAVEPPRAAPAERARGAAARQLRKSTPPAAISAPSLPPPAAEAPAEEQWAAAPAHREAPTGPAFLMCFDDTPRRTVDEKIHAAMESYAKRFNRAPTLVWVNPDVPPDTRVDQVTIERRTSVRPNMFWVGMRVESPSGPGSSVDSVTSPAL